MKSPNDGEDRVPTGHLLSLNKVSINGTGLHPSELLAKSIPWKSPTIPAFGWSAFGRNVASLRP